LDKAWRERNDGLATFMSEKIVDNANYLAFLPPRDRELLASKLLDIGKAILRAANQGAKSGLEGPVNAIRWLQRAFSVIEPLDATTHGLAELKRSILRSLARGYFLSSSEDPENLSRAEVVIQELIDNVDGSVDQGSSEYQQLRWMRLAVVKRRKAGDSAILEALNSIIDYTSFSEANLAEFVQLTFLHNLLLVSRRHVSAVVTAATQRCLNRVLEQPENDASVDKLLLSLIFHTSKDDDHARAMLLIQINMQLLWQYGNRHYQSAGWDAAAGWYMCGAHAAFKCLGPVSDAKCFRKAALCYVHKKEYARAASVIRKCSSSQATTQYVVFLIAVHQAVRAVQSMVTAPDFDRKMLLLACQLSHEMDLKTLLLTVLRALLDTLNAQTRLESMAEAMTLIRCIIRLVLKLLGEPVANRRVLISTLLQYFSSARSLVEDASPENRALVIKDLSWLWRTAYNTAIQGCSEWDDGEEKLSDMFELSVQLLELYIAHSPVGVDASIHTYLIDASFAAISGRVIYPISSVVHAPATVIAQRLRSLSDGIKACKRKVSAILAEGRISSEQETEQAHAIIHVLRVFEVEIYAQLHDWASLMLSVEEAIQFDASAVLTFEAIADILVRVYAHVFSSFLRLTPHQFSMGRKNVQPMVRPLKQAHLLVCAYTLTPASASSALYGPRGRSYFRTFFHKAALVHILPDVNRLSCAHALTANSSPWTSSLGGYAAYARSFSRGTRRKTEPKQWATWNRLSRCSRNTVTWNTR
ncbi:hypothetical protein CONPUDRAFT_45846, partial [Coniophora puteana RWD-64-598 SS2]